MRRVRVYRLVKTVMIILIFGMSIACVRVDELNQESRTVQLDDADSVEANFKIGAGELRIQGGAEELMEADFSYNIKRWKPEVDYHILGKKGLLSVEQSRRSGIPLGRVKNIWNISLNNNVPLDLTIDFGAGEGRIDLHELALKSLEIEMGAGDLTLDLTGIRKEDLEVHVEGGVGHATLYLPEEIGVRVKIDGGLGSINARGMTKTAGVYTNDAYGESPVAIKVEIEAGIGSIDLRLRKST